MYESLAFRNIVKSPLFSYLVYWDEFTISVCFLHALHWAFDDVESLLDNLYALLHAFYGLY